MKQLRHPNGGGAVDSEEVRWKEWDCGWAPKRCGISVLERSDTIYQSSPCNIATKTTKNFAREETRFDGSGNLANCTTSTLW